MAQQEQYSNNRRLTQITKATTRPMHRGMELYITKDGTIQLNRAVMVTDSRVGGLMEVIMVRDKNEIILLILLLSSVSQI